MVAGLTAVVYITIITAEGIERDDAAETALIAASFASAALAAAAGSLLPGTGWRLLLLSWSATTLIVWGFLGIFSIGLPLLVAGILSAMAVSRTARSVPADVAVKVIAPAVITAVLLAVAVLALGGGGSPESGIYYSPAPSAREFPGSEYSLVRT